MIVGIAIYTDTEADHKSAVTQKVSDALTDFFSDKSYGDDILSVYIGFLSQRPVPGFEAFQKARKPRYVVSEQIELLAGGTEEDKNSYSYDVSLDEASYERFVKGSEAESIEIIKKTLIDSLVNFDKLPKKIKQFDAEGFKAAMVYCLNEGQWNKV